MELHILEWNNVIFLSSASFSSVQTPKSLMCIITGIDIFVRQHFQVNIIKNGILFILQILSLILLGVKIRSQIIARRLIDQMCCPQFKAIVYK